MISKNNHIIEYWKNNQKTCLVDATEVTEYAKTIQENSLVFSDKKKYGAASSRASQSEHGIASPTPNFDCVYNMQNLILLNLTILERRSHVQEGHTDHSLLENDSNEDKHLSHLLWHAISFAITPQCVIGLFSVTKRKKFVIVKHQNFPQTTSRT